MGDPPPPPARVEITAVFQRHGTYSLSLAAHGLAGERIAAACQNRRLYLERQTQPQPYTAHTLHQQTEQPAKGAAARLDVAASEGAMPPRLFPSPKPLKRPETDPVDDTLP